MHAANAIRRTRAIRSTWLLPLVAVAFLLPNGMNRVVIPGASVDPVVLLANAAIRISAMPFATLVAARCVDGEGRTTYVDLDDTCVEHASRSEVFVFPDQNVAQGMSADERTKALRAPSETAPADVPSRCVALKDMMRVIDEDVKRPGPWARADELRELRRKAAAERQRLLC